LELIRSNFVDQTNASAFLAQIQQDTTARFRDSLERSLQLRSAVTSKTEQAIAGQAF
jgi:hypothetical protein